MKEKGRWAIRPKTLFLIDSLGAMLTAFNLFFVLKQWEEYVGMPETILNWLSGIALVFCLYSCGCFVLLKEKWKPFLRIIIVANLLYSALTIALVIDSIHMLTWLGIAYFVSEFIVIVGLVSLEIKTLRAPSCPST